MSLTHTNQAPSTPSIPSRRLARRAGIEIAAPSASDGRGADAKAIDRPYASQCGLDPAHMGAAERLNEVGKILALGIIRLKARQNRKNPNDQNHLNEFGLDFSAEWSVSSLEPADRGEGR